MFGSPGILYLPSGETQSTLALFLMESAGIKKHVNVFDTTIPKLTLSNNTTTPMFLNNTYRHLVVSVLSGEQSHRAGERTGTVSNSGSPGVPHQTCIGHTQLLIKMQTPGPSQIF